MNLLDSNMLFFLTALIGIGFAYLVLNRSSGTEKKTKTSPSQTTSVKPTKSKPVGPFSR
jgi:hypothetical protein